MSKSNKWIGLLVVVAIGSFFLIASKGEAGTNSETAATTIPTSPGIGTVLQPTSILPSLTLEPPRLYPDPESINEIGLFLNKVYATKYGNYYFSPESVYTVLNMIGISATGNTREELDNFTGINNYSTVVQPEYFMSDISFWYSDDLLINDSFVKQLGVSGMQYSTGDVVKLENWIEGRLGYQQSIAHRSLFAPESEIAFAIENSFSISEYLHLGGSSISARFSKIDDTTMRIDYYCINSSFFESTNREFRLLSIPSEDHNKQLVIVQPFNKYDAMKNLSGLSIEDIERESGEGFQENTVCIPQGKYFSEYDFTDPLIEYGIRRIFFPDVAELTNLTNSQSAFISGIYSFTKSNFEVLGEHAAYSSLPEETLWLDSPFLYFEIDKKDSLLLGIGRLISP